jgi:hypothetical protein
MQNSLRRGVYEAKADWFSRYGAFLHEWGHDPVAIISILSISCVHRRLRSEATAGQNISDMFSAFLGKKSCRSSPVIRLNSSLKRTPALSAPSEILALKPDFPVSHKSAADEVLQ